jgi:hypothetical protein
MASGRLFASLRRSAVIASASVMVGVLAPTAGAASSSCRVTNLTTQQVYVGTGSNLQTAIGQATSGTTLRIRGICVGTFSIGKSLTLIGWRTAAFPSPTLDGAGAGTVLRVSAGPVVIHDLTITGGYAEFGGGGINNRGLGVVRLTGSSSVWGNDGGSGHGGGIYNEGTVDLRGSSAVRANNAGKGGGIYNAGGTVRLHGSSSVSQNLNVFFEGGGIFNEGTLVMNDTSSIWGNEAVIDYADGGGIANFGRVTLNDRSSVRGNVAGDDSGGETSGGGGILNGGTLVMRNHSTVRGNTALPTSGGGGITNLGTLVMRGAASVRGNAVTDADGGGISNFGSVTMNGSAYVTRNRAVNGTGGGIFNHAGTLVGAVAGGNVFDNIPDDIAP